MYDFYFGAKEKIEEDPLKWLIAIKRMLPRYVNGVPDSEYEALYYALREQEVVNNPVLVESGCGASTLVLLEYALRHGGELYTWDICSMKLWYMRGIITDTLMRHFNNLNLSAHWKHIAFSSVSLHAGISMLREMNKTVTAGFFDSEHTAKTLLSEVGNTADLMHSGGIIAIDDANYFYKYQNTAYINMIRTKQGLPSIEDPVDNKGKPFHIEVENLLKQKFNSVNKIDDTYKKNFQNDIFWSYYDYDRRTMADLSMEKTEDLIHRFDAWRVNDKNNYEDH